MKESAYFNHSAPVFHGRKLPEEGVIVAVGAASPSDRMKYSVGVGAVVLPW